MTRDTRKSLLLVAAPFGFGPASKAWLLTEALRAEHRLTVNVEGPAAEFLRANLAADVELAPGRFSARFPDTAALANFDAFVSVNHVPALRRLEALGLIGRSIFVDSLSQWRTEVEGLGYPEGLLAHLVQDYPSAPGGAAVPPPPGSTTVAPIISPGATGKDPADRRGIVIHTGGLTIASTDRESMVRAISAIFGTVFARARDRNEPVTFLGNPAALAHVRGSQNALRLSGASPAAAVEAIGGAKVLITTPGIGAVYEAMACATPMILLPPMNSTQSYHYDVLTGLGMAGTIGAANQRIIRDALSRTDWAKHGALLLNALARDAVALLARLDDWLDACLDDARADERGALIDRASAIFAALSTTPADAAIARAVATLTPRATCR